MGGCSGCSGSSVTQGGTATGVPTEHGVVWDENRTGSIFTKIEPVLFSSAGMVGDHVSWVSDWSAPSTTVVEHRDSHGKDAPAHLRTTTPAAREHLYRIYSNVAERKIPMWPHVDLTYKCNTDCIHCYCQHLDPSFGGTHDKRDMTTEEVYRLLDQLADAGALFLTLSGGELFVRKDFLDIAFYASRKCHFALTLYTNGTLLTEFKADKLVELAPMVVEISLQGATAEVHDKIVGQPGSFDKVCASVRMLRRRGLNVVLKTTIMQPNYDQADDIVRLAIALDATTYRSSVEVTPKNDGDTSVTQYQMSDQQLLDYFASDYPEPTKYQEVIPAEEAREKSSCGTGTVACYISPYGEVYPCIQLLVPMGNIREQSFTDIWGADSELRRKLEKIQTYGDLPDCKTCEYVQFCQRCHGLALMETGDFTKCYKMVLRLSKVKSQVNAMVKPQADTPAVAPRIEPAATVVETRSADFTSFGH